MPGDGTPPTTAQICSETHKNVGGADGDDYSPHHEPFEYYASTANPMHKPPTSVAMIGRTDQANHQYDIADFWAAADAGNLPAVSYLKAPKYQDAHAGYSDPLDEQTWLVNTINQLQTLNTWRSTAVVITYDDSDGWYDHVLGPLITQSQTSLDALTGKGFCGSKLAQVPVNSAGQPEQGKCGVGPRLPFLVISPWARLELGGQHLHRPELGGEVHRVQLAPPGPGQRRRRQRGRGDPVHVRLQPRYAAEPPAVPRSVNGRAGKRVRRAAPAKRDAPADAAPANRPLPALTGLSQSAGGPGSW